MEEYIVECNNPINHATQLGILENKWSTKQNMHDKRAQSKENKNAPVVLQATQI